MSCERFPGERRGRLRANIIVATGVRDGMGHCGATVGWWIDPRPVIADARRTLK
jgi:hypothetical protein